jgi:hypothetical protein
VSALSGALTGIALMALLAGCGGGDKDEGPPSGYARFEQDGVTVDYPKGWEKDSAAAGTAGEKEVMNFHGPPDKDQLFARVRVLRGPRSDVPSVAALGKDIADTRPAELNKGRHVSDGKTTVPGSKGAWKVVTDFKVRLKGGGERDARANEVIAVTEMNEYLLTVGGPDGTISQSQVDEVLKSFRLG